VDLAAYEITYTLEPLCHRFGNLALRLLPIVLDREVVVHIFYQGMVMYRFTGTVPAVSDMHSGSCVVTVGSFPADG
jgi:hypothetical protein